MEELIRQSQVSERLPEKDWTQTDLYVFTTKHHNCEVKTWGGYIEKHGGFEPFGWTIDFKNLVYYFGLDGHFIKTKAI